MKLWKKIVIAFFCVLVAIQFIRPARNVSAEVPSTDISRHYKMPASIQRILTKSCTDCHSNNTNYPWYSNIQPVSWWLNRHIKDGKRHLNFSEFTLRSAASQYHKLEECIKEIESDEMPLPSYTLVHKDAVLNAMETRQLIDWFNSVKDSMKARYPVDSLLLKRK